MMPFVILGLFWAAIAGWSSLAWGRSGHWLYRPTTPLQNAVATVVGFVWVSGLFALCGLGLVLAVLL